MKKTIFILAILSLVLILAGCQKKEEITVEQYFQAMQHDDADTRAAMSLEPKDIEFTEYEILSIEEPVTKPLELPALFKKIAAVTKARKEQTTKVMDLQDTKDEAEEEMEDARGRAKKKEMKQKFDDLVVQYEEETQKIRTLQLEINGLKDKLDREKAMITLSTNMSESLEMFDGTTTTAKVTVKITLKNGEKKDYVFLTRGDTLVLKDRETKGRLIIVKIMTTEEYELFLQGKDKAAAPVAEEPKTEEVAEEKPATEGETTEEKPAEG
ncbi:MAG: hypothetical protein GY765_35405 [bacterium]|nr:hypothetical protein [bacterium]